MKQHLGYAAAIAITFVLTSLPAKASFYDRTGWVADLQTYFHGVSGTVTIVDEDTVRVEDFSYDGNGIVVYLYLGADTSPASFNAGLAIGDDLVNYPTGYSHVDLGDFDVTGGLDGWNAISVWCVVANVDFGSGSFVAPPVLAGDANNDGVVDAEDFVSVEQNLGTIGVDSGLLFGDANDDGRVDGDDYIAVEQQFGSVYEAPTASVPEPAGVGFMLIGAPAMALLWDRRSAIRR